MAIWIFIILNIISCAHAMPVRSGNKYTTSTEYIRIEKLSGPVYRHKRSAALIFPNTMTFRFQIEAGMVTLNLERTSRNHHDTKAPIYTIEQSSIKVRNHTIKENFALYQDLGIGGSVLVKYPANQLTNYKLMGAFTYKGDHYQITPLADSSRHKRDASTHLVERQAVPYGDFYGDELLPPPSSAGFNMPDSEQPPFPAENFRGDSKPPLIRLEENHPNSGELNVLPTTSSYPEDVDYLLPPGMGELPYYRRKRRKRDSETVYIEYMVVADYKNTETWKARVGGETDGERLNNAFNAMYEYYQFVINGVDVRFRTATATGPSIRVVFASLLVSTSVNTSPWITNNKLSADTVDDAGCLLDFAIWKKTTYSMLPNHDHAGLFTGFDLATPSSRSTLGMAYLNSICAKAWGVSANEETYNAIEVHIAGHELGHNIGSRHDGSGNSCKSSSLYLMAARLPLIYDASLASNPWTFSTCSQSAIQTFVSSLGESSCLLNQPTASRVNDVAGLVYSADEQCNMTYGNDAVLCRERSFYQWDSICYAMQCKEKGQSSCIGRIFPFDGTPCGNKKWCQGGRCIYSENAPVTHETCVHGDDPHSVCSTETACSENDLYSREVICCGTCLTKPETTHPPYSLTVSTPLPTNVTKRETSEPASSTINTQHTSTSIASNHTFSSVETSPSSSMPDNSSKFSTLATSSSKQDTAVTTRHATATESTSTQTSQPDTSSMITGHSTPFSTKQTSTSGTTNNSSVTTESIASTSFSNTQSASTSYSTSTTEPSTSISVTSSVKTSHSSLSSFTPTSTYSKTSQSQAPTTSSNVSVESTSITTTSFTTSENKNKTVSPQTTLKDTNGSSSTVPNMTPQKTFSSTSAISTTLEVQTISTQTTNNGFSTYSTRMTSTHEDTPSDSTSVSSTVTTSLPEFTNQNSTVAVSSPISTGTTPISLDTSSSPTQNTSIAVSSTDATKSSSTVKVSPISSNKPTSTVGITHSSDSTQLSSTVATTTQTKASTVQPTTGREIRPSVSLPSSTASTKTTTSEQKQDLSFEIQTMISLFLSTAMVI